MSIKIALRDNPVKRVGHVLAHRRVAVLVDGECRQRVLEKQVDEADFDPLDGQLRDHFVLHEVGAFAPRLECDLYLFPHHGREQRKRVRQYSKAVGYVPKQ